MQDINLNEALAGESWEFGRVIPIVKGSGRHRIVIHCSPTGRQEHEFANGPGKTAAYVELIGANGSWIAMGAGIVPVLPDGRLIMVVEQRPPQGRFEQATHFISGDELVDLAQFGPYPSLEFPGGAIDNTDKSFKAGFMRELHEETGAEATGTVYMGRHLVHAMGSDIAVAGRYGVIYLSGMHFESRVQSDGGLAVFALSERDVLRNIYAGNIRSGQAALINWFFYLEIQKMRLDNSIDPDFITVEEVTLKK